MARILIIDDRADNRRYLVKLLGYGGHQLLEASDGVDGLQKARAETPDLIISDILMPTMDGFEFVRHLREDPSVARTPVVFCTATYHVAQVEKLAHACGVRHILAKPTRPDVVLRTVGEVLGLGPTPKPSILPTQFEQERLKLITGKLHEHLDAQGTQLAAIIQHTLELSTERDLGQLLERSCHAARYIVGTSIAALGSFAEGTHATSEPIASGTGPRVAHRMLTTRLPQEELDRLSSERLTCRLPSAASDNPAEGLALQPKHRPALLMVPIVSPTRTFGWICLIDKLGAEGFSDDDERLASVLAAQLGRIYESGLLFKEVQRHALDLEREVAERKRAETERDRFFTQSLNLLFVAGFDGYFKRLNPAWEPALGYSLNELLSRPFLNAVHPDDRDAVTAEVGRLSTGQSTRSFECRSLCKDGSVRWFLWNVTPSLDRGEMYGTGHDVTERKRSEETNALLAAIVDSAEDAIFSKTLDGIITSWNAGAERLFGYPPEEIIGKNIRLLIPPEHQNEEVRILDSVKRGEVVQGLETVRRHKDGRLIDVSLTVSPVRDVAGTIVGASKIVRDVTGRKRLEEQFRQAQKMEAVGSLAGGVAHDFNNLLTIINGYSDLIPSLLPPDSPALDLVQEIGQAGERAASLTRQLLVFSRKQVLAPKVLNLNAVVTDTAKMLKRLLGEDLDLNSALEPGLGQVKADPGQIEQVLMNLAVNARDAMPRGGKLTIETANTELDETYVQAYPDLRPGPYVMLAVTDTGTGMDESTKARIFEPFFTTKEPGKGTGLGLATVFGIVKQSQGHVAVYSELGRGTTFKIYLPIVAEIVPTGKSHPGLKLPPRGTETILLTEDEPSLRALARHVLSTLGYVVLEAGNGEKAIHVAEEYKGTIHLLVTDVVMPGMSGRQLAEYFATARPGMKVLYLSGYTDDAVVRHGVLQAQTAFLQKPYRPAALAQKVREVLDVQ